MAGRLLVATIVTAALAPFGCALPTEPDQSSSPQVVEHVVNLRRVVGTGPSSRALHAERTTSQAVSISPATFVDFGGAYGIDVQFGREQFTMLFDTGSSDAWLPTNGFQCVGPAPRRKKVPQHVCNFHKIYPYGFSGGEIADQNFNVSYASGSFLIGKMGYESVTIGRITVPKQEAALVDYGHWYGDKYTTGLIGFGFPIVTSAFPGTDPSKDNRLKLGNIPYKPFIFNAIDQGSIQPMFSYVFDRRSGLKNGDTGGQIALGGVPNVTHGPWTSTPLQKVRLDHRFPKEEATEFSYYTITPDGFQIQETNSTETTNIPYTDPATQDLNSSHPLPPMVVDSGTTRTYLPSHIVAQFAAAIQPPSKINFFGSYSAKCDAIVPPLGVTIGGRTLWLQREDLILTGELGQDPYDPTLCFLGVQPTSGEPYILGDTFLKALVTVHDLGAEKMWFAQREW